MSAKPMQFAVKASWLIENNLMADVAKIMAVKHGGGQWLDGGKGVEPEDDVMLDCTEFVQLEVLHKTGKLLTREEVETTV